VGRPSYFDSEIMRAKYQSSVVISVYKDSNALSCILYALSIQSADDFEVIVSEDGCSEHMAQAIAQQTYIPAHRLLHLSQEDKGFRKNRALNNAIRASRSSHIIFIDGDCVPSIEFVKAHRSLSSGNSVTAGRRLELGPKMSRVLREQPRLIKNLSSGLGYLSLLPKILLDRGKNVESGLNSSLLHYLRRAKPSPLLGCNFSCPKIHLEKINGFNEEYEYPGLGEDTDLQWRLERSNVNITDAKFLANLFHLFHERTYGLSEKNLEIFKRSQKEGTIVAKHGIVKH